MVEKKVSININLFKVIMYILTVILLLAISFVSFEEVYAKGKTNVPSDYSGVYIGKITAVNDFMSEIDDGSAWDWVVELDGIRYNTEFITNSSNKSENSIWVECRKLGAEDESGSSTVVCTFNKGYITKLCSISDVIEVNTNVNKQESSIYYQDGNFKGERKISLAVNTQVKSSSPYTKKELDEALGKETISVVTKLKSSNDYIAFDDGTSKKDIELNMALVDSKKINVTVVGKGSVAPQKSTNFVRIISSSVMERATILGDTDISFQVGNLDFQKTSETVKNSNTQIKKHATAAKSSLSNKVAVALDSNLDDYFSTSQINEMEEFLTIWLAEIVESQTFQPENYTDQQLEKVRKKILNKMGISVDSSFLVKNATADVIIEAQSKTNDKIKIRFFVNIQSYTLSESSSPFGSYGNLEYEIINTKYTGDKEISGIGVITYANVQAFTSQIKSIADTAIKGAYNEIWGKNANKVAELFISEPVLQLMEGDFSGKVYKLVTNPTEKYIQKFSFKCPVDVYVLDWDGNCRGAVINNEVSSEYDDIFISVDGDQKFVYLTQGDYIIKLVGNASGTMEYDIDILDDGNIIRSVKSEGISLTEGREYYAVLPYNNYDQQMISLTDMNGNDIEPTSDSAMWNGDVAISFAGGSGTSTDPYIISSEGELKKLSEDVNSGNDYCGQYFILSNDLDLNFQLWTGIGNESTPFRGIFDGNGYSVANLCVIKNGGLFGVVENGEICNLFIQNTVNYSIGSSWDNGKFIDGNLVFKVLKGSSIKNCIFDGLIYETGGIADYLSEGAYIIDCKNYGETLSAHVKEVAGIVRESHGTIEGCINYGYIGGTEVGAGISAKAEGMIENCVNYGVIEETIDKEPLVFTYDDRHVLGGIVGCGVKMYGNGLTIKNCQNHGFVNGHDCFAVNAYLGEYDPWWNEYLNELPPTIIGCSNDAEIKLVDPVSGSFGDNITYELDKNGILYINGHGCVGKFSEKPEVEIGKNYPWHNFHVKKIIINEGIEEIADNAFYMTKQDCDELILPDGLKRIGYSAFAGMIKVSDLSLPNSLEEIDSLAFSSFLSLGKLTLPDSLKIIERGAFSNCRRLSKVKVLSKTLDIGYAFDFGCLKEIAGYVGSVVESKYENYPYVTYISLGDKGTDSTGNSTGDSTGGTTGGSTSGSTGGSTGGTTGGSMSGSMGESTSEGEHSKTEESNTEKKEEGVVSGKQDEQQPENQNGQENIRYKINISSKKLAVGTKVKLSIFEKESILDNTSVIWCSSNKSYATINKKGVVNCKKAGIGKKVTITAKSADGTEELASITFKIMKNAVTGVKIKKAPKTLKIGESANLKAVVTTNGNSANTTLKWTSSNTKYVTVSKKGKIIAKRAGKGKCVVITVTSTDGSDKKTSIKVKVK